MEYKNKRELAKLISIVENSGKAYFSFNADIYKVDVNTLIEEKYILSNIVDPNTNERLVGCIRKTVDKDNLFVYTYNSCDSFDVSLEVNLGDHYYKTTYSDMTKIELEEPTREDSIFKGWKVVKGNSIIKGNTLILGTTETVVYAIWENYPKLTVKLNGGATTQSFSSNYNSREMIILEKPIRKNYTFKGWKIDEGDSVISGNRLTIGSENVTISALWEINKYDLVVNLNYGETTQKFNSIYEVGAQIELDTPTRLGYTFVD